MNLPQVLDYLRDSPEISRCISDWRVIPARPPQYAEFPSFIHPRLLATLRERGIFQLYTHQASALEAVASGRHIVVVTPTASGKTLCYNIPVLNTILGDPDARAMYLFPTKALSQDQLSELHGLITSLGEDIKTYTFDGDTPQTARLAIRTSGHIVVTNPDMLHQGILPHHTKWVKLFENLKYVVIDEIHNYRGIFGSHLGNLVRRLKRICAFYGSHPCFILCSATIANPAELAQRIIEEEVTLIDNNGAPSGEKHFILYNPPVVNKELGIRRSVVSEAEKLASLFVQNEIQTILFARSRVRVEILLTYLREAMIRARKSPDLIRGYRGGYLPLQRREIEKGLRDRKVLGVVSTNALELGIDIGQLEVSIMAGYPGTISSTWQQVGRAGRRNKASAAILVASSAPLDQFLVNHPDYFFGQTPESGIVDPNNLIILTNHLKCSAFEIPFRDGERFGLDATGEILRYLEEHSVIHHAGEQWHWMSESYPAEEISLRSASPGNFVILNRSDNDRVIGEVDYFSAPMLIHEGAIYLHEGAQYQIEELDWEGQRALAKEVEVDYYTDAHTSTDIQVLDVFESAGQGKAVIANGEVKVTTLTSIYKKIKMHTHENVGWGKIHLPEQSMHTTSFWLEFGSDLPDRFHLTGDDFTGGLRALSNVLGNIVPLFAMCDPKDIRSVPMVRAPFSQAPTIYLYDNCPGGVGLSRKMYAMPRQLLASAGDLIGQCTCDSGCPSCVGPSLEVGLRGKETALRLIQEAMS